MGLKEIKVGRPVYVLGEHSGHIVRMLRRIEAGDSIYVDDPEVIMFFEEEIIVLPFQDNGKTYYIIEKEL